MVTLPQGLPKALEDAAYVSVGLGVLALQRARVRRRELERQVATLADEVEERLPEPARTIVASVRRLTPGC